MAENIERIISKSWDLKRPYPFLNIDDHIIDSTFNLDIMEHCNNCKALKVSLALKFNDGDSVRGFPSYLASAQD